MDKIKYLTSYEGRREALIHPSAGGGEPICNVEITTMVRVYSSRKGWELVPHEYTCTRGIHKAGPHVAHDIEDKAVVMWPRERDTHAEPFKPGGCEDLRQSRGD